MNISKATSGLLSMIKPQTENNTDSILVPEYNKKQSQTPEDMTLASDIFIPRGNLREGMFRLSPIDRYNYMTQQKALLKSSDLTTNPEKALKDASRIINEAIIPPAIDGHGNTVINQAQQIRRQASMIIDKAA